SDVCSSDLMGLLEAYRQKKRFLRCRCLIQQTDSIVSDPSVCIGGVRHIGAFSSILLTASSRTVLRQYVGIAAKRGDFPGPGNRIKRPLRVVKNLSHTCRKISLFFKRLRQRNDIRTILPEMRPEVMYARFIGPQTGEHRCA